MENKRGIFFSSDLMLRFGEEVGTVKEFNWHTEVNNSGLEQIPNNNRRGKLQKTLLQLNPSFVATGHEPCIKPQ